MQTLKTFFGIIFPIVIILFSLYPLSKIFWQDVAQDFLYNNDHIISKNQSYSFAKCVRIVVPFVHVQHHLVQPFMSRWMNSEMPMCGINREICIHLHLFLDSPKSDASLHDISPEFTEEMHFSLGKIMQYNGCIRKVSFSLYKDGDPSYWVGSYDAVRELVWESHFYGYSCMFLMELDVYPIRSKWLDHLYKMCYGEGNFLIKGTIYQPEENVVTISEGHINGNCIWNVSNRTLLDLSFKKLEDYKYLLWYLPAGYDVLFPKLFIDTKRNFNEGYGKKWLAELERLSNDEDLNANSLTEVWTKLYIDSPLIINDVKEGRTYCKELTEEKVEWLQKKYPNSLVVHCNPKPVSCLRLVVPFFAAQASHAEKFLSSWFSRPDFPCCGNNRETCIHLHFQMDTPASLNIPEDFFNKSTTFFDAKIAQLKRRDINHCIQEYTFSIFQDGNTEYHLGSFLAMEHLVMESHGMGYLYMAVMELDILPLYSGWLDDLYQMAFHAPKFLIQGSTSTVIYHKQPAFEYIDKNCIWNVQNEGLLKGTFEKLHYFKNLFSETPATYDMLIGILLARPDPVHQALLTKYIKKENLFKWGKVFQIINKKGSVSQTVKAWSKPGAYFKTELLVKYFPNLRPKCSEMTPLQLMDIKRYHQNSIWVQCKL